MVQRERIALARIDAEWSSVQDHLRTIASAGASEFKCLPPTGAALEAVRLRSCAAELKKYGVVFGRIGSAHFNISDEPEKLVWHLRCIADGDRLTWRVDRVGKTLSSEEVAQTILAQLGSYCRAYEQGLSL
jgi:hypothetical protein